MAKQGLRPERTPDSFRPIRRRWQNVAKQRRLALPAQRRHSSLSSPNEEGAGGRSQPRLKVQAGVARVARVPRHPRPAPLSFERDIRPAARLTKRIQIAER